MWVHIMNVLTVTNSEFYVMSILLQSKVKMLIPSAFQTYSFIQPDIRCGIRHSETMWILNEGFHWGLITWERERERQGSWKGDVRSISLQWAPWILLPWASLDTCFLNCSSAFQSSETWVRKRWAPGQVWTRLSILGQPDPSWARAGGEGKRHPSGHVLNELI